MVPDRPFAQRLVYYDLDYLLLAQLLKAVVAVVKMLVKVKLLTGNQTEIDIDPTDTIWRIKERVEEKAGIDPKQQRLIFGGRQLADERPANEYNIEGGSVLHLVIALRGGSY